MRLVDKMNVYDFDNTIYKGDSTIDFYFFCLKKTPSIIFCLPKQVFSAMKYSVGILDKTSFKEAFFSFLKEISNTDELVVAFWNYNQRKIKQWYLDRKRDDDVIISASPSFLLYEICNRLGVDGLIASEVNKKTGEFMGINCYGIEKVRRFSEIYSESIDCFFSDSVSDLPLRKLAKNGYLIKGNNIIQWII